MLKVQFKDGRREPFWVVENVYYIGRGVDNHLVIDDDSVDDAHAKIVRQDDIYWLRDQGSQAGTFVNAQSISAKPIVCGDEISIGSVILQVIDPLVREVIGDAKSSLAGQSPPHQQWSLIGRSSKLSGQEFPLRISSQENSLIVGRGSGCDIVIHGTHLSRLHAEIAVYPDHLVVRDLGSVNGTFVNDEKIQEKKVCAGDMLRLDIYSFHIFGPGFPLPRAATTQPETLFCISPVIDNDEIQTKRWKTRPTSPGNREEPTYEVNSKSTAVVAACLVFALLGLAVYLFLAL